MPNNKDSIDQLAIMRTISKIQASINRHPRLSAFIIGALLTLIFSPFEILPILFLGIPILLHLLRQQQRRGAFALGFAFGYGHYLFSLYWIAGALLTDIATYWYLVPLAVFGIPIVGALYTSAAMLIAWHFRHHRLLYPLAFAISWALIEYLRSFYFIPFPFNLIGYSSIAIPQLAILAKSIGILGLSTILLIIAGLLHNIKDRRMLLISLVLFICSIIAGQRSMQALTDTTLPPIRLVQPNVLDYEYNPHELYRVRYQALHELSLQGRRPETKIIIWPENSFPLLLIPEKMRKSIAQEIIPAGGFLISGTVRRELDKQGTPQFYNSLIAMDAAGEIIYTYDKHLLAPFGEYIPYHQHLPTFIKPFLEATSVGEFNAGNGKQSLSLFGMTYLPSICFEGAFPQFFQFTFPNMQGNILINVTNDMWFGQTIGPHQHLMAARFRAIESGLPMLRVANTGITAVITPTGKVIDRIDINEIGFIDVGI
jgi:apolipoprotein N-acyltransferase